MEKWRGYEKIGKPIPRMVALCRAFIEAGWRVKVFTARVADVDMEDGYTPEVLKNLYTAGARLFMWAPS